ncbi:MAG: hypothetical protein AB1411_10335 [Nitrospirota bacterium]
MLTRLHSLLTTRCPICQCRDGVRVERRSGDRFYSMFFIYPFECRSCNYRFRAFWFHRS